MAMVIGLGSHKGGVGKTTFARAIALVAAAQDLTVHIADLDQEQQTAFEWAQRRRETGRKPDISVDVYADPAQAMRRADEFERCAFVANRDRGCADVARHGGVVGEGLDSHARRVHHFEE